MHVITYSLRDEKGDSERYYLDAASFSDEVMSETDRLAGPAVERFAAYAKKRPDWTVHSKEEYGFELLVLGTLWKIYSVDANGPDAREQLEKLLDWLDATGEFDREVKRLRKWKEYFETLNDNEIYDIVAMAITLAAWFEVRSEEALGRYTANVENYLNEVRNGRCWYGNAIFCGRRRVEYHLNMVGAEIMNRAYRDVFDKTKRKLVLLPACMRLLPANNCEALKEEDTLKCVGCTSECSANKVKKLGAVSGFDVLMVPHESSISGTRTGKSFLNPDTGVVGIACVLNLISGGLLLNDNGIPAQCVLLDYCGCKQHWNREGLPTEINMDRLKKILDLA